MIFEKKKQKFIEHKMCLETSGALLTSSKFLAGTGPGYLFGLLCILRLPFGDLPNVSRRFIRYSRFLSFCMQAGKSSCHKFEFSYHEDGLCKGKIQYGLVAYPDLLDKGASGTQD